MPAVILGPLIFPTVSKTEEHIRAILRSAPRGRTRLSGEPLDVVTGLLNRHPEAAGKIGPGLAGIWTWNRGAGWGSCFLVERTDGSLVDFSYKRCLRPDAPGERVTNAFRTAIGQQLADLKKAKFATTDTFTCPVLGIPVVWANAHVDHEAPATFAWLLDRFLAIRSIDRASVMLHSAPNGLGRVLESALAQDWAEWHRANAVLRVISAQANSDLNKQAQQGTPA